jgi:ubiquinone/menaquinone biosynthesis C-methylase UbiE
MNRAFGGVWTSDLAGASFEQRWRVFKAEHFRIGPWCTRLAVREELRQAKGAQDQGLLAGVTPQELLDLYGRIEESKTASERYAILAQPLPERAQPMGGRRNVWFDAIHGLTSPHIIRSVGQAAYELATSKGTFWEKALDLGTGTGNLTAVLLGKCSVPRSVETLLTVDREQPLLAIARERHPEARHLYGDVTALPFPDDSFELVTSGGLAYGLGPDDRRNLFSEVARVLRPGGVYLDGDYRNRFLHPDNVYVGPKHDLESMIVSHIAPTEIASADMWETSEQYFAQFGLQYGTREYRGAQPNEITDVRVLTKQGE